MKQADTTYAMVCGGGLKIVDWLMRLLRGRGGMYHHRLIHTLGTYLGINRIEVECQIWQCCAAEGEGGGGEKARLGGREAGRQRVRGERQACPGSWSYELLLETSGRSFDSIK